MTGFDRLRPVDEAHLLHLVLRRLGGQGRAAEAGDDGDDDRDRDQLPTDDVSRVGEGPVPHRGGCDSGWARLLGWGRGFASGAGEVGRLSSARRAFHMKVDDGDAVSATSRAATPPARELPRSTK